MDRMTEAELHYLESFNRSAPWPWVLAEIRASWKEIAELKGENEKAKEQAWKIAGQRDKLKAQVEEQKWYIKGLLP